jgi:hypothetical protein
MNAQDEQIQLIQKNTGFLYPYGLEIQDIFWPAMIIPQDQLDSSLPKISNDEMILQFFEKKVTIVPKDDPSFVRWDSNSEPFKSFCSKYHNHKTSYIRKAAIFMSTGEIDNSLKWLKWKKMSNTFRQKRSTFKERKCDKVVLSDLSDWTDASLESI